MNQNEIIIGAINNLIDESKKILIPNSITTLTANLNEACKYKEFFLINYDKYVKQIIDDSTLPTERKEEIRKKFNNPQLSSSTPISKPIQSKVKFYSNQSETNEKSTPAPIKIKSSSPTLVTDNVAHYDDLQQNPPIYRKTIYCRACELPIEEEELVYYSGYPYHNNCIKCMKCPNSTNISTSKTKNNYISITPGLFLCRKHYQEYLESTKISSEISEEYHKKNKENFVKELFNIPFKNEEIFVEKQDEEEDLDYEIVTRELIDESIPIKRPFDDFVPTMTVRFDKLPEDIDYDKLKDFIGPDFDIVSVEKGSAIIKLAYLEEINTKILDEDSTFLKKCNELDLKFKGTIGKGVVGNVIGEPIYSLPDDQKIQDEYNKPWLNALQNMHELDQYDLEYIKKSSIEVLKNNAGKKNWAFIFKHNQIYEDIEKQIIEDVKNNEIELIIVAQTIITNKNIDKYYKIVKKIKPDYNQKQLFLYHGTALKNHQLIVNNHFLMPGKDKLKHKTDSGYYGKGIYATNNMFYASKYANGYKDLDFNEKSHVICCMSVYNESKVKELYDLSLFGKEIDKEITKNYGIHHAFVGSSNDFKPIKKSEKDFNYISADEFVFPNKFQIIPIYSFTVMRKDHFILWKDENFDCKENQKYLQEISRKTQVNVYNTKSVDEALNVIKTKKRNKFKLITNGGGKEETGRQLIEEARKIIKSDFICFVFAHDKRHLNWITKMTNVLYSSSFSDFKKFVDLKLNEEDVYNYAIELKNKYDYDFKLDKSQMLNFPTVLLSNYDVKNIPKSSDDLNEESQENQTDNDKDKDKVKNEQQIIPENATHYDVIALGTGFKECLLSGLLLMAGKKVLQIDKNNYFGGDCASLNLSQFFNKFFNKEEPKSLGYNRDWNIDLIPKLIMADGLFIKALIYTKVNESLNFQPIDGSYVYKNGKVDKLPCTTLEVISTNLFGFLEKRYLKHFLEDVSNYLAHPNDSKYADIAKITAFDYMKRFKLDVSTMTIIGHAMALEPDDTYLKRSARELISKLELYVNSNDKFKAQNSPYLYPIYGLGDIPQAFSRLCSIYGSKFMIKKPIDDFIWEGNKAVGIKFDSQEARAPVIIGDPSYFYKINGKLKKTGKIIRAICLLNHPVFCIKSKIDSGNIIIPQTEVGRKHDIYVCFTSYKQRVCPEGWYVALVSTFVETDDPEREIKPGLDLLGPYSYRGVAISDVYESCIPGSQDNIYCSSSYDPTTHFETTMEEVLKLYEEIMGEPVKFS